MNLVEHMFMQAAGELAEKIQDAENPAEVKCGNEEALEVLKRLDAEKLRGLVVMGLQKIEPGPNGEPGYELISSMIGSPELIVHLASGARVFTQLHQLNDVREQMGIEPSPLLEALLGGSAVEGGVVKGRYDVPEGATKQ